MLHFFIACSFAAVYYAASRRLAFLMEHPLVCGLFYGAAVEVVMDLVVLPLSALHARGPYTLHDLILGLLVHMVVVGLPIAFSVRWFANQPRTDPLRLPSRFSDSVSSFYLVRCGGKGTALHSRRERSAGTTAVRREPATLKRSSPSRRP